jgi:hypothetical protein
MSALTSFNSKLERTDSDSSAIQGAEGTQRMFKLVTTFEGGGATIETNLPPIMSCSDEDTRSGVSSRGSVSPRSYQHANSIRMATGSSSPLPAGAISPATAARFLQRHSRERHLLPPLDTQQPSQHTTSHLTVPAPTLPGSPVHGDSPKNSELPDLEAPG